MRVYLAATTRHLRQLLDAGAVAEPLTGFAATRALLDEWSEQSDEELESALSLAAGEASAGLPGGTVDGRGRRVVIVADLGADQVVVEPGTPGAIAVQGELSVTLVAAILADANDIALGEGMTDDLAWFATQEISDLLA